MFPTVESDIIVQIYKRNEGDLQSTISELLDREEALKISSSELDKQEVDRGLHFAISAYSLPEQREANVQLNEDTKRLKMENQLLKLKNAQLREKFNELVEKMKCTICMENDLNIVLLPCKHLCLCSECSETVHQCK